jgi:hypothetical protein
MKLIKNKHNIIENLKIPKFKCDGVIDPNIPTPLPNQSFSMLVVGPPRSGKTSIIISLLTNRKYYKKKFNNIYVIAPQTSLDSLKSNPFKDLSDEKKFDNLSMEALDSVINMSHEARENDEIQLLYMDDVASELKNIEIQKLFNHVVWNRRHMNLSVICISQSVIAIPPNVRRTVSHIIYFKPNNMRDYNIFCEEYLSWLNNEERRQLYKFAFREKNDFLYIDVVNNKLYKKFDEIQFDDNDDDEKIDDT